MQAPEELEDGSVEDGFDSCGEDEDDSLRLKLHAGQRYGLKSIAAAGPKSERIPGQAAAKECQPLAAPGAPEGPAGPAEVYTKMEVEVKLAAVQISFMQELVKVVKLCQERNDQLQQALQHERARNSNLTTRVTALEAAKVQLTQP